MPISVAECYIYPLKSAKAIKVDELSISKKGPIGDRFWMLVKKNGDGIYKFISQRDSGCEKLSQIEATIENSNKFIFKAPNMNDYDLSLDAVKFTPVKVSIWGDDCNAMDAGDSLAKWFSNYLGIPCRLVKMNDEHIRNTSSKYSKKDDQVGFADSFPLLITSHESLDKLNEYIPTDDNIGMERFRPNIVLKGIEAFEEDVIHEIRIGEVILHFVKPCTRCKITTIDQDKGIIKSPEPLKTLSKLRRGRSDELTGVFFGQNAIPQNFGIIKTNDIVEIISKRPLHPALENSTLKYKS